jgi:hypothetical protein
VMKGERLEENSTRKRPPGVASKAKVGGELASTTAPSGGARRAVTEGVVLGALVPEAPKIAGVARARRKRERMRMVRRVVLMTVSFGPGRRARRDGG